MKAVGTFGFEPGEVVFKGIISKGKHTVKFYYQTHMYSQKIPRLYMRSLFSCETNPYTVDLSNY